MENMLPFNVQKAAERISEAVLQLTYQSCPMETGPNLKQDTYTHALIRAHKSSRNELYIIEISKVFNKNIENKSFSHINPHPPPK